LFTLKTDIPIPPFRFPTTRKLEFGERAKARGPFTPPNGDPLRADKAPVAELTEYPVMLLESAFET